MLKVRKSEYEALKQQVEENKRSQQEIVEQFKKRYPEVQLHSDTCKSCRDSGMIGGMVHTHTHTEL